MVKPDQWVSEWHQATHCFHVGWKKALCHQPCPCCSPVRAQLEQHCKKRPGADPTLPGLMGTLMQVWFKGCLSEFPVRGDRITCIKSDYEPRYSNVYEEDRGNWTLYQNLALLTVLGLLTDWTEISLQSFLFSACYYEPEGNQTNIKACFLRNREMVFQPVQVVHCHYQCCQALSSFSKN